MYTIYAYWNADQVYAVLNAVALIMNGGDYAGLIKAITIVGILIAAGGGLARMKGEEPLAYVVMFALFYGVLFIPRATVTVQDVRAGTVYTVDNVPLGVAFFASQTSHIGYWMTEAYETAITPLDDLRFEKTGMAFGARLVEELQAVKVRTPSLRQDLVNFVKDCVNPELLDNPTLINELVKSTDTWAYFGGSGSMALNPGRATFVGAAAVPCAGAGGAYSLLTTALATEGAVQLTDLGARMNPGASNASDLILAQTPAVEAAMLNVSRTAQEAIKQGMVANMMRDSQATISQIQGNPQAAMIELSVSMAEQSSAVSYASMAKVAEGALPKLRNAIELMVIGIFPVMFLLVVLAGAKAGMVLKSYAMATIWVQLWAPLYAIINFISFKSTTKDLLGIVSGVGGSALVNMKQLGDSALSNQAIAGLLTISVPIIALALVKGGEVAMSGVASSIMSPANSAAQKAGDAVGQGNISAGNVNWGNTSTNNWSGGNWSGGNSSFSNASANSDDRSARTTDPNMSQHTSPYATTQRDGAGNLTGVSTPGFNMGGGSVSGGTGLARNNTDNSGDAVRATQGRAASLDIGKSAISSDASTANYARALTSAINTMLGASGAWSRNWNAGTGQDASKEVGGASGLENREGHALKTDAGAGAAAQAGARWGDPNAGGDPIPGGKNATGGQPGGGQPGGGQPGGGQPAGGKNSPQNSSNVPALLGDDSAPNKGAPKMGSSLALALRVGAGFEGQNAQAIVDAARNSNGTTDKQSQAYAAAVLSAAHRSVMSQTTDTGTQNAGRTFMADLQGATRANEQTTAGVTQEQTAGQTRSQGTTNQVGGAVNSGAPVAMALIAANGGDVEAAARSVNPGANPNGYVGAIMQATQGAAGALQASPEGGAMLGAGGAVAPDSQGAVATTGHAAVNAQNRKGAGAVAAANAGNVAKVEGHQHANPMSKPDTSPAAVAFNAASGAAYTSYQDQKAAAAQAGGAVQAAAAIYKDSQSGVGTTLANSFLRGLGYESQPQLQQAFQERAATSPKLASTLQQINASGGQISPAAMDFLKSELKAHEDSKPGTVDKAVDAAGSLLDRVLGGR